MPRNEAVTGNGRLREEYSVNDGFFKNFIADGRVLRGEVVGTDPAIDVALIRVAGAGALPEAPLGNSDELRVGE